MKTVSAIINGALGESVTVYATGETDPTGKLIGGIRVCCASVNKKMRYTKSCAELIEINRQIAHTLVGLRHKVTISGYRSEEAMRRDYDDRWSSEEAMKQIRDLCEMQHLFSRLVDSDGCSLQAIDTSPHSSPIFSRTSRAAFWVKQGLPTS